MLKKNIMQEQDTIILRRAEKPSKKLKMRVALKHFITATVIVPYVVPAAVLRDTVTGSPPSNFSQTWVQEKRRKQYWITGYLCGGCRSSVTGRGSPPTTYNS